MANIYQRRRGTTAQNEAFVGGLGEISIDTDKNTAIVHDGKTPGGSPLAKVDDAAGFFPATETTSGTLTKEDFSKIQNVSEYLSGRKESQYGPSLIYVENGILMDAGKPIFEIGINWYSAFHEYCEVTNYASAVDTAGTDYETREFLKEATTIAEYGWKYVRVQMLPFYPKGWGDTYYADKTKFYEKMATFLDVCADNGLSVIFTLFVKWDLPVQLHPDETVDEAYSNPNSATLTFVKTVTSEIVQLFKDHPAVGAWEDGNEYNIPSLAGSKPHTTPEAEALPDTILEYDAADGVFSIEYAQNLSGAMREAIDLYDTTNRALMSGSSGSSNLVSGNEEYADILADLATHCDCLSTHEYRAADFSDTYYKNLYDILVLYRKKGKTIGKPLILGEFGISNQLYGGFRDGRKPWRTALEAVYRSGTQLALIWDWADMHVDDPADYRSYDAVGSQHPKNTWTSDPQYEALGYGELAYLDQAALMSLEWQKRFKAAPGYVDPDLLSTTPTTGIYDEQAAGVGTGLQTEPVCMISNEATTDYSFTTGWCVSFWLKVNEMPETGFNWNLITHGANSALTDPGWRIALSDVGAVHTFIHWNDATQNNTLSNTTIPHIPADGWRHYAFQLNCNGVNGNLGLTAYIDGMKYFSYDFLRTSDQLQALWTVPTEAIALFAGNAPVDGALTKFKAKPSKVSLKNVMTFNRNMSDEEIYNLYHFNQIDSTAISGLYKLDGNFTDSSSNGRDLISVTGPLPGFETFNF